MNDAFPEEADGVDDTSCYAEIQYSPADGQHGLKEGKTVEGGSDVFQRPEAELLPVPGLGFKTSVSRRGASRVGTYETSNIIQQLFENAAMLVLQRIP